MGGQRNIQARVVHALSTMVKHREDEGGERASLFRPCKVAASNSPSEQAARSTSVGRLRGDENAE